MEWNNTKVLSYFCCLLFPMKWMWALDSFSRVLIFHWVNIKLQYKISLPRPWPSPSCLHHVSALLHFRPDKENTTHPLLRCSLFCCKLQYFLQYSVNVSENLLKWCLNAERRNHHHNQLTSYQESTCRWNVNGFWYPVNYELIHLNMKWMSLSSSHHSFLWARRGHTIMGIWKKFIWIKRTFIFANVSSLKF